MAKGQKTGGRVKGTPNKLTADVKNMVLAALDKVGGIQYLEDQARANPTAFMTLVGKVLPLQISNADDKPFRTTSELSQSDKELINRYLQQTKGADK